MGVSNLSWALCDAMILYTQAGMRRDTLRKHYGEPPSLLGIVVESHPRMHDSPDIKQPRLRAPHVATTSVRLRSDDNYVFVYDITTLCSLKFKPGSLPLSPSSLARSWLASYP